MIRPPCSEHRMKWDWRIRIVECPELEVTHKTESNTSLLSESCAHGEQHLATKEALVDQWSGS